jgi:membrane-anchored glycerophosphoryl diester phosphodiesterase (GDPDase)
LFVVFLISIVVEIAFMGVLNIVMVPVSKSLLHVPIVFRLSFNYLFSAVISLVMGPLFGGLYFVYLKTIRQQPASVGNVFAGFQKAFSQLFLGSLVVSLIVGVCMLPFNFVWETKAGPLMQQLQQIQNMAPAEAQNIPLELLHAFLGGLPVLLICLIPMTYLVVSWQFTLPLIIDKQMNFWPAMKASWKMVNRHWWQIFGLTILIGLVSVSGLLLCCVGVLFTAPIGVAALMYAYETIFSPSQTG